MDRFRLFYFKYYPPVYNTYIQYLKSHLNNQGFSIFIKHLNMHEKIILKNFSQKVLIISKNKNISFVYGHIFQHLHRIKNL